MYYLNIYAKLKYVINNNNDDVEHNKSEEWINGVKKAVSERRKEEDMINAAKSRQQLGKLPKWKVHGPDKVYGFWIKEFLNIHEKIITHLNKCLENGKTS